MSTTRLLAARLMMAGGMHRFSSNGSTVSLLVLNYHRLRATAGATTRYDDGVFDTDVATFRRQMEWLKANTVVLDEDELLRIGSPGECRSGGIYSVVTFDDGYVDCMTLARPILDEMGMRGIFFIPVEMLESRRLGWWDLAANLLKKTTRKSIVVDGIAYDLSRDFAGSLRRILNRFKLEPADSTATLLEKLSLACDAPVASPEEQGAELMTWTQVRDLRAKGHAIGAHSLTHRVLATLDTATQAREIDGSRTALEAILGVRISSFAYPVGGYGHINHDSVRLARLAGFDRAFTFNTGLATLPVADPFQIPRESARTLDVLKAKALLPNLMGLRKRLPVSSNDLG